MEHAQQIKTVAKVAEGLKAGGWFLFTSGDHDGSIQGCVDHKSMAYDELEAVS